MRHLICVGLTLAGLTFTSFASAEQDAAGTGRREGGGFLAGGKVGGIVPFGGYGPMVIGGVEVGWVFPWLHRSFAAAVDVDFTAPSQSGEQTDPRLVNPTANPQGKYTWHLTTQQLALMPIVMYRLTSLGKVTPFIGVGPRIYFLKSIVRSDEGNPVISETTEQSTSVGVGVPLGVEFQLGPGGLLAEVLIQYGGLEHTATGSSNTGGASLGLGYRLLL